MIDNLTAPVQLAREVPLSKVKFPCYLEPKYDGVRVIIIRENSSILIRTRNGKRIHLPAIESIIASHFPPGDFVLDTEVTLQSGKMEDRTTVSGMINSALHGNPIAEHKLVFNCFDILTLTYWKDRQPQFKYHTDSYRSRRFNLVHFINSLVTLPSHYFRLAPSYEVNSIEEANEYYSDLISNGYEGCILKHADSTYDFKRSSAWVKMKETKSADLKCTGYLLGEGKYEGLIGSLVCSGIVENEVVHVNVGSGLTDYDRELEPYVYVGKTIEVKYNSIVKDKRGSVASLFLPRFVAVRFDK